ncbi:type IV pilus assembly protein PilO [Azomonas agilis]|uniref:Type IV pilus assembly protein PilO n=1 Tax=Azomonas agilis TaxID=116849 RepID=A0A562IKU5_9GAMM|nr:type 4a pilus biogenesis protein PilO [Azomonas agilis]TWH71313.1 type IV pilus assembly protein PilO [Azomonas agilis]
MSLAESLNTLRNMDISDLDINNLGVWPTPIKVAACLILFILTAFAGYNLHITDLETKLEQTQSQEPGLKTQFASKSFQVANLEAYRQQLTELEQRFNELLHQLPRETEVPALLEDMTRLGVESGLEFEEIKLQPERKDQFYIELPIQVKVLGDYHDLATFVSNVTSMQRIVTLHDFELKPAAQNTASSKLRLSILAKTYRYNDQGSTQTDTKPNNPPRSGR